MVCILSRLLGLSKRFLEEVSDICYYFQNPKAESTILPSQKKRTRIKFVVHSYHMEYRA